MKSITIILLLLAITAQAAYPQETARERIEQRRQAEAARNSQASAFGTYQSEDQLNDILENSRWSRTIYRYIDLSKPENAPLYQTETKSGEQINLFAKIFTLLQSGDIKAYEYLDGRELFTVDYLINFAELTDRFGINYETSNVSEDVQGYYLKEVYYLDTPTSSLRVLPVAICPIIERHDKYRGTTRYPLFWVPYTQIEPYAKQMPVILSSLNNSVRGTIDDFFKTRRYSGEIVIRNTTKPEEVKAEQNRIEKELTDFENMVRKNEISQTQQSSQKPLNQSIRRNNRSTGINTGGSQTMRDRRY